MFLSAGYGSKRGAGFESRLCRMFVIRAVHIHCSKIFKGMECIVLFVVLCTINNPWSHSIRGFLLSWYCHRFRFYFGFRDITTQRFQQFITSRSRFYLGFIDITTQRFQQFIASMYHMTSLNKKWYNHSNKWFSELSIWYTVNVVIL